MAIHATCDGLRRRDFLKIGALGGTWMSLAGYFRLAEAGQAREARAQAAIFISLTGGPSHIDTFDLKPEAPSDYRGEFAPIATNLPGLEISEHLPKLARFADKFALLRGVTHTLAAHPLGQLYVNTGNRPIRSLEYPGFGAVVSKELGGPDDLPPFVAVPNNPNQRPGFLGVQYAPFNTGSTPRPGQPFRVRGISLDDGLTVTEFHQRHNLLEELDRTFDGFESDNELLDGLDRFSQQARAVITSPRAREAFDVSRESPRFARPFGPSGFGQSCLLAVRLVEAGVRFVTIASGGWDTHRNNWDQLRNRLLPPFDQGLAALLNGLEQRGLLESTVVLVTGEFGRTPRINQERVGRDHWPRCMSMLMAGGGIRGGLVHGASDDRAMAPVSGAQSPDDVAATFYHALGVDHTREYHTNTGRPITIVRDGRVIRELFG